MQERSIWRKIWAFSQYVLMIGAILGVIAVMADQIIMPIYIRQGQTKILPDTQGMEIEDARALLESRGFKVIVSEPVYTVAFPAGVVYDQNPFAGTKVKVGRRVYISPTLEERLIVVPKLFGLSERNAILEIERSGFVFDTVLYEYSSFHEGMVIAQSLPKRTEAKRGTPLAIEVSLGSEPDIFVVPDMVDKSLESAKDMIAKSGLRVGKISYRIDPELIPYTVLYQSITAETVFRERVVVNLIVSITGIDEIPEPPEDGEDLN